MRFTRSAANAAVADVRAEVLDQASNLRNDVSSVQLGQIVDVVSDDHRVENTKKVYDRVSRQWQDYCAHVVGSLGPSYPTHMSQDAVFRFMFYNTFRKKQSRGGVNGGEDHTFDKDEYESVLAAYSDHYQRSLQDESYKIPDPEDGGLSHSAVQQYRAGLKKLHDFQVQTNATSLSWDKIWTQGAKNLVKIVESRKARIGREKYQEKVNKEFAGYHAVDRYEEIEEEFWKQGFVRNIRSAFAFVRHRMLLLYTVSGILRCESLVKGELSDFQGIWVKKDTDIHPLYLMVSQIPIGKTNHGQTLYGRATRHRNVLLCALGAMAMYLMLRFSITNEFQDPDFDWLDNSAWFHIKLLVDPFRGGRDEGGMFTKPMRSSSYGKAVAKVFSILGMVSSHLVHVGRVLGAKILEFLEIESEWIRFMGNWNPSMQEACYSTKLPMVPIRALAGFTSGNGIYHNKRTTVVVPMELQKATPIGRFVFDAQDKVSAANVEGQGKDTAAMFLQFLEQLNIIFLQDMAVIALEHEDRLLQGDDFMHPLLRHVEVLNTPAFLAFTKHMEEELQGATSPLECHLEAALPGVHQRLDASQKLISDFRRDQTAHNQRMDERMSGMEAQNETLGRTLVAMGRAMMREDAGMDMDLDLSPRPVVNQQAAASSHRRVDNSETSNGPPQIAPNPIYANLFALYEHWFGKGVHERDDGWSMAKLEADFGTKWRNNFIKGSMITTFTRCKIIMTTMENQASNDNTTLDETARQWSDTLAEKGKFTIAGAKRWLVEQGFLALKATRGKHATVRSN